MGYTQIVGGQYKGFRVKVPDKVRPLTSMLRKKVFDYLGQYLEGCKFLDLFAGSGCVGLEALSRGADFVAFVEKNKSIFSKLVNNVKSLDPEGERSSLFFADSHDYLKNTEKQYDFIFADPPYRLARSFSLALSSELVASRLTPEGIFILHWSGAEDLSFPFTRIKKSSSGNLGLFQQKQMLKM